MFFPDIMRSLRDFGGQVTVEEESLHLKGLQMFKVADSEVSVGPIINGLEIGLAEVAFIEVIRLLDEVFLFDEGTD